MTHADRVGIGKREANFTFDLAMIFDDHIAFAAQVLRRRRDFVQDVTFDVLFSFVIDHWLMLKFNVALPLDGFSGAQTPLSIRPALPYCVVYRPLFARDNL